MSSNDAPAPQPEAPPPCEGAGSLSWERKGTRYYLDPDRERFEFTSMWMGDSSPIVRIGSVPGGVYSAFAGLLAALAATLAEAPQESE